MLRIDTWVVQDNGERVFNILTAGISKGMKVKPFLPLSVQRFLRRNTLTRKLSHRLVTSLTGGARMRREERTTAGSLLLGGY